MSRSVNKFSNGRGLSSFLPGHIIRRRSFLIACVLVFMAIGLATTLLSNAQTNCSNANPCVEAGNDVVGKSWQLDFSDEFNGSSLDNTKWVSLRGGAGPSGFGYHTYVGNPYNNNENAFYNTANTTVSGGNLNLTLKPENNNGFPYSTGMVQSGPFYAYSVNSYVEARIKVPSCSGCWPAFWSLQSPTESVWPPEFDIFEFFGTDNWRWPNFQQHWGPPGVDNMLPGLDASHNNPYGDLNTNYTGDYHIYGMYWDGNKAVPYLDGVAYPANAGTSNLPTGSMYLIMQLALGKGYSPAGQNTMSVDWIRVWKPATASPPTTPTTPPASTPTTTPTTTAPTTSPKSVANSPISSAKDNETASAPIVTTNAEGKPVTTLVIDTSPAKPPQTVKGLVSLPKPSSNSNSSQKIIKIDGANVSIKDNELDTKYLTNGKHTITIAVTENGKTTEKTVIITVDNKLNPLETTRNHVFAPLHGNKDAINKAMIGTSVTVYIYLASLAFIFTKFVKP